MRRYRRRAATASATAGTRCVQPPAVHVRRCSGLSGMRNLLDGMDSSRCTEERGIEEQPRLRQA